MQILIKTSLNSYLKCKKNIFTLIISFVYIAIEQVFPFKIDYIRSLCGKTIV